ncbi:MAG: ABC transporter ATP-binding protein [Solirubrobacteraceae bacterium]
MDDAGAHVVVSDVTRSFGGETVVDRASLELEPGELVALTGPSGAGKSTLLQLIGGLDRPDSGQIDVDGIRIDRLRHPALYRRRVVGFVFQLHHLLPTLTAIENVALPTVGAHVPRSERRPRALALLDEVGLGPLADRRPSQLSGGERQRVAIARALVNRPRLLLADEPTGSLDSTSAARVLATLLRARERYGMTALIVSYDLAIGERADRRLRILDGCVSVDEASPPSVPAGVP